MLHSPAARPAFVKKMMDKDSIVNKVLNTLGFLHSAFHLCNNRTKLFPTHMISSTQTNHPLSNFTASSAQPTSNALEQACSRLKAAGLRITQPRIAILNALIKRSEPATIEQIHLDLKDSACDLVTVYRCLAAFEELGLVRRCFFHNGTSLYQIQFSDEPVYHVVSKDGAILETVSPELSAELRAVVTKVEAELKGRGYTNVTNMVAFFVNAGARQPAAAPVAEQV